MNEKTLLQITGSARWCEVWTILIRMGSTFLEQEPWWMNPNEPNRSCSIASSNSFFIQSPQHQCLWYKDPVACKAAFLWTCYVCQSLTYRKYQYWYKILNTFRFCWSSEHSYSTLVKAVLYIDWTSYFRKRLTLASDHAIALTNWFEAFVNWVVDHFSSSTIAIIIQLSMGHTCSIRDLLDIRTQYDMITNVVEIHIIW